VTRCTVTERPIDEEVLMNGNGGELSGFLTKLSEDAQLQDAYTQDPEGTMRAAGLSEDTIGTILSRDLAKIKALLEREVPGGGFIMFMIIVDPNNT
jgi:hypothetical protein